MNVCEKIQNLPDEILQKKDSWNVFYSEEYYNYSSDSKTVVKYYYSDMFLQVVTIHRIQHFFCTATLPSEPMFLGDGIPTFQEEQVFLDQLMQQLEKNEKVDWLTVTPASTLFCSFPSLSQRIKFGNYILDISGTDEEVFKRITSKHRNMIRRGEKSKIEYKIGGLELLEDYIQVDKQTWERSGENTDHLDFYRNYVGKFSSKALVAVAYKDSVPQCGILGIYNEAMFYYMFGASADHPEPGSTHFLQWQTMRYLKERNVKKYNFVGCRLEVEPGSKYENIQRFKKGFGGELVECYLFKLVFNKVKKKGFDLIIQKRTGKVPYDVVDQEIVKWKQIN